MRKINILEKQKNDENKKVFCFLVCGYNMQLWILFNLRSIFSQKYTNYRVVLIDDCSTDKTVENINEFVNENNLHDFVTLIINDKNYGPAYSRYVGLQQIKSNEIVVFLDGDDWLFHDQVLNLIASKYDEGCEMTYGSFIHFTCLRQLKIKGGAYDVDINSPKRYHLRTGYKYLWDDMPIEYIKDSEGEYLKYCTDFNELLWGYFKIPKNKVGVIEQTLIVYNIASTTTESNPTEYKDKICKDLNIKWNNLFKC